jgi:RHS repeat-associated protein
MFYNADSGLYLTQFRAYDPVVGRWLSRDPSGEARDPLGNLYTYVGDRPIDQNDPLGLCSQNPEPIPDDTSGPYGQSPDGTPIDPSAFFCTGAFCENDGTWGASAMYDVNGLEVCRECAVKLLGLENETEAEKLRVLTPHLIVGE